MLLLFFHVNSRSYVFLIHLPASFFLSFLALTLYKITYSLLSSFFFLFCSDLDYHCNFNSEFTSTIGQTLRTQIQIII